MRVGFRGRHVGDIVPGPGSGISFRYADGWDAFPISLSLPPDGNPDDAATSAKVGWFFQNLLPEGDDFPKLCATARISPNNLMEILGTFGTCLDCALEFGCSVSRIPAVEPIPITDYLERRRMGSRKPLRNAFPACGLLAGARDKIPCVVDGGRVYAVAPGTCACPTHILKPSWSFSANEHFCMELARLAGIDVPSVEMIRIGDELACLVGRYDVAGGVRLHQEDFCQAMGLPPYMKYDNGDENADFSKIGQILSHLPPESGRRMTEAVAFDMIVGNGDAHAKNFSILRGLDGGLRLAPFYDITSSSAEGFDDGFAFRFGNATRLEEISDGDFALFAIDMELEENAVVGIFDDIRGRTEVLDVHLARECRMMPEHTELFRAVADVARRNAAILGNVSRKVPRQF